MPDPASLAAMLEEAIAHHRAGRLAEAGKLYAAILDCDPNHADALHLLGVVAQQEGHRQTALTLIEKAIAENPRSPEYYNSLGAVRQGLGDEAEALRLYLYAIQLKADYLDPYRNVLRLRPGAVEVRFNLACALQRGGEVQQAMDHYAQVVSERPDHATAFNNMGCALRELGRVDEALGRLQQAVTIKPDYAEAHYNLGLALHDKGLLEKAVASYVAALALKPNFPDVHCSLGRTLHHLGRHEEAIGHYQEAIRLVPGLAKAHYSWGCVLDVLGRHAEAIEKFAEAILYEPDYVEAHVNRAIALLVAGRYAEGWGEYEWRLARSDWQKANSYYQTLPRWDGAVLADKTILVQAEQGFGDTIQFARYFPLVKARCGRLIVEAQPELHPLLETIPEIDELSARESGTVPEADCAIHIVSLGRIFGTTLESIPSQFPYLHAPAARVEKWSAKISRKGFRIGIAWSGNQAYPGNKDRSCELDQFAALAAVPGVRLFSLQKGQPAEQILSLPPGMDVVDLGPELHDFADTAAAVTLLDLIVSVDTALVHLAGALGRPVWTLRYHQPYWVWGKAGPGTPWYPSMRVFRQQTLGDWDGLFREVVQDLAAFMPQIS